MVSDIIDTVAPVSASIGNRRIIYLHMYLDWKLMAFLTITKGLDELQGIIRISLLSNCQTVHELGLLGWLLEEVAWG